MLLAQQPSIYYVYDDLNRLVVVVDRLGNAATYTYDAVGNILRIDRFDASGLPGAVAISLFVPSAGKVGTSVQVFGKGLAPNSMLSFAGRPATITAGGLYTAPVAVPVPSTIMIAATHLADPANAASATVTILPPLLAFVEAPLVSLTLATSPASSHIVTAAVSVALADVHAANLVAALTSVAVEPIVSAVAPLSGMPGTVTALTVAGRGLAGATALTFLRDNAADASVTATNLSVSPDGNRVIADVTIASGAPSGARVVRVVTPDGTSTAAGTGGNVFTIP